MELITSYDKYGFLGGHAATQGYQVVFLEGPLPPLKVLADLTKT
jgi:hypothetical protein